MPTKSLIVLEQILNTIPYFIFWKDRSSNYLGANERFARAAGFKSVQELVGKSDYDACWKREEADFFRSVDRRVMELDKAILNIEEPQMQLDGTTRTLLTSKVPLHDATGMVVGILGIYTDITDRKLLEEEKDKALRDLKTIQQTFIQTEKLRSLGEMAGGIAHEINNPLAIMNGFIALIRKLAEKNELTPGKLLPLVQDMEETVRRISSIISGLRTISRDHELEHQEAAPADLFEVVMDVVGLCEQRFRALDIDFKIRIPARTQVTLRCNRVALEQALLNLLNNARDAVSDPGVLQRSIVLEIAVTQDLCIKVIDSGPGIKEEHREKIFEPFFTTKEVGSGTGIGLSLSKGLVEKQGARLYLDEREEQTTFVVRFPAELILGTAS